MTYQTPSSYWGIPEEEASRLPLGLRSSNNLFNIKYFKGAEKYPQRWPGLMGPSEARDQGDPQMKFATVEDSGVAGAELLRRKYQSGMRTPRQIIAGNQGWTPGYAGAAENVARVAGVGIDDDLKLDTPEGLRRFLPALAEQEHGADTAQRLFKPEMYDRIMSRLGGPAPSPNQALDGAPQPAAFAQRSPKPMAEDGGFFSNLMDWANTPIGEARRRTQPIRDRYADGDGNLNFTTEEFLAKYPGLNKPGIREQIPAMLDVYRMGRDLNSAAINERSTPQAATWGQGLGEALKLAGSVATARNSPQLGMQMAQGIGADWRANNDMRQKLALQSALQQAQALTAGSDAAIKDSMARIEAKRNKNAIFRSANMPIPHPEVEGGEGATAVPSGTTGVGGVSASPVPVERGTLPDVGAQTQAVPQTTEGAGRFSAPVAQPQARAPIQSNAATGQSGDDLLRKSMAFSADKSTEELGKNFMEQYKLQQGSPTGQAAERAKVAESLGMKPGDQAYQSYVATGKMPREDQAMLTATDKKAIMEAEELALAGNESVRALKEASAIGTVQKDPKTGKEIRPNINTGYTASFRAGLADKMPDLLVPDFISSKDSAQNTINYDNLVLGQALSSLKATFGAAPTEGERKILLELQASSGMSPEARKPILERAIALAERRVGLYNDRAKDLRGGDYYKPKDGTKSGYNNVPRTSAPGGEGNRTSAEDPLGIR